MKLGDRQRGASRAKKRSQARQTARARPGRASPPETHFAAKLVDRAVVHQNKVRVVAIERLVRRFVAVRVWQNGSVTPGARKKNNHGGSGETLGQPGANNGGREW